MPANSRWRKFKSSIVISLFAQTRVELAFANGEDLGAQLSHPKTRLAKNRQLQLCAIGTITLKIN